MRLKFRWIGNIKWEKLNSLDELKANFETNPYITIEVKLEA